MSIINLFRIQTRLGVPLDPQSSPALADGVAWYGKLYNELRAYKENPWVRYVTG